MQHLLWSRILELTLSLASITLCAASLGSKKDGNSLKTEVFLSRPFTMGAGSVVNDYYYDIDFPRGHIALKSFNAEVVDEEGNSVPLYETYLHHWTIIRNYGLIESGETRNDTGFDHDHPKRIPLRNAGPCTGSAIPQYYGLGSETRRTDTWVPDPYGIEIGNPKELPKGYQDTWTINVHAIDTRGVKDRMGCTEGKCSLYNVTKDEFGKPLRDDYVGGYHCCYNHTQCSLREGFKSTNRKLYMRYTVKWVEWDESMVPVKVYIIDVTDTANRMNGSTNGEPTCKVEYDIEPCSVESNSNGECVDTKNTTIVMPRGGEIAYAVAHQHSGGIGAALYGQDGRLLCASFPTYGTGREAGNEAGHIVGMTTCSPSRGSAIIADGEALTVVFNYSSRHAHTGVMGHFYFLLAELPPTTVSSITSTSHEGQFAA